MANLNGFWSYVHKDDEADGGRISRLARDVASQFEMLTGETISLFLDIDKIEWGEDWKNKINTGLATVGFFVAVLTPRYFQSPECRRELTFFANRATEFGVKGLVLPILYVDFESINNQESQDELIQLVKTFQREDWRDLRFLDINSEGYRRGVAKLANSLVEANKKAEEKSIAAAPQEIGVVDETEEEEPGVIEVMADFSEKLQKSPETLTEINVEITAIGQLMRDATADITKDTPPNLIFATRLAVTKRLAHQLHQPIERIWTLSNELASQMYSIDKGYRLMIRLAPAEIENDPSVRKNFCKLFGVIRTFTSSWDTALDSVQGFMTTTEPLDKLSRDLRPALRRLREGLTIMLELRGLSHEWLSLVESSDINCDDVSDNP